MRCTSACRLFRAVHPRMCGEHYPRPNSRGITCRFIPACAGNMKTNRGWSNRLYGSSPHVRGTFCSRINFFYPQTVHPRMCGEHTVMISMTNIFTGSSPHVRGTFYTFLNKLYRYRFIPACAGNIPIVSTLKRRIIQPLSFPPSIFRFSRILHPLFLLLFQQIRKSSFQPLQFHRISMSSQQVTWSFAL